MTKTVTSSDIIQALKSKKPVGYYNEDNKEKKDNENNYCNASRSDNGFSPSSLESSPGAQSFKEVQVPLAFGQKGEEEPLDSGPREAAGPMPIFGDMKTAIIQFFDNGETQYQRYKCKVRINLTDGENPEFIANLTKEWGNFKKYIPEECKGQIIKEVMAIRKAVKEQYGVYPYIGKFHLNTKEPSRTIEPYTFAAIWYNASERSWSGILRICDWEHKFDLITQFITDKQRSAGVKAQDTFTHPDHQKKRPLTWAERRRAGK
jgi:hypothetical protein